MVNHLFPAIRLIISKWYLYRTVLSTYLNIFYYDIFSAWNDKIPNTVRQLHINPYCSFIIITNIPTSFRFVLFFISTSIQQTHNTHFHKQPFSFPYSFLLHLFQSTSFNLVSITSLPTESHSLQV